jgi:hypothetical protein
VNTRDISEAKDPLLRASLAAMQRAAALARQTAIETNTGIVLFIDGQVVRIPAAELKVDEPPRLKSA